MRHLLQRTGNDGAETVVAFLTELRQLSEHCAGGHVGRQSSLWWINDNGIQQSLLGEATFSSTFDIAQAMEMLANSKKDIQIANEVKHLRGVHCVIEDNKGMSWLSSWMTSWSQDHAGVGLRVLLDCVGSLVSEVFRLQISQGHHILAQSLSPVSGGMESEEDQQGTKSREHNKS